MSAYQHKQWDMTAVDGVIERAVYNFPALYRNRTEVLATMFLTPGTGYAWKDGVLHNSYYDDHGDYTDEQVVTTYEPMRISDGLAAALSENEKADLRRMEASMRAKTEARNTELLNRRANAASLARTPGDPTRYLIHHHTHDTRAHTPPADIKPDWEAARQEILAAAEPLWAKGVHFLAGALVDDDLEARIAHDAASPRPRLTPQAADRLREDFRAAKVNPNAYRDWMDL